MHDQGVLKENLVFFYSHVVTIIILKNSSLTMLNGAYILDYGVARIVFLAEFHIYFAEILKIFFSTLYKCFHLDQKTTPRIR